MGLTFLFRKTPNKSVLSKITSTTSKYHDEDKTDNVLRVIGMALFALDWNSQGKASLQR